MKTYEYFQPEYIKKFKCDGQACNASCCRRGQIINIDKKTYKQYSHIKPKNAARELTLNIKKNNDADNYTIKLDETGVCPFLTEKNLCKIQCEYGEKFLPETCVTYPRHIWSTDNSYECSLTLSCPVAAKLILLEREPLKFETVEILEKTQNDSPRLLTFPKKMSENTEGHIITIQKTAISVLQERSLTIEQRLLMLGLYCDKLDELLETGWGESAEKIQPIYQNPAFLQEQVNQISAIIKFDAQTHIKVIKEFLEKLYDEDNLQQQEDRKLWDSFKNVLQIKTDENNQTNISESAEKYIELGAERQKFVQRFSNIFENYLVNECFLNFYPFRFIGTTIFNYGIFVIIYKMLEILTFSSAMEKFSTSNEYSDEDLISEIVSYVNRMEHITNYWKKLEKYLKGKEEDIITIMNNMLQI